MAGTAGLVVKKPQPLGHTPQSTPACDASFVTAALSITVVPNCIRAGAKGTKAMEWVLDATIVIGFDEPDMPEKAVDAALIVTGTPGETGGAT